MEIIKSEYSKLLCFEIPEGMHNTDKIFIKDDTLIKEVRNYYSDLKDKNIYYYSGDKNNNGEYIKLDK